jgi:hypothetical protein
MTMTDERSDAESRAGKGRADALRRAGVWDNQQERHRQ